MAMARLSGQTARNLPRIAEESCSRHRGQPTQSLQSEGNDNPVDGDEIRVDADGGGNGLTVEGDAVGVVDEVGEPQTANGGTFVPPLLPFLFWRFVLGSGGLGSQPVKTNLSVPNGI